MQDDMGIDIGIAWALLDGAFVFRDTRLLYSTSMHLKGRNACMINHRNMSIDGRESLLFSLPPHWLMLSSTHSSADGGDQARMGVYVRMRASLLAVDMERHTSFVGWFVECTVAMLSLSHLEICSSIGRRCLPSDGEQIHFDYNIPRV